MRVLIPAGIPGPSKDEFFAPIERGRVWSAGGESGATVCLLLPPTLTHTWAPPAGRTCFLMSRADGRRGSPPRSVLCQPVEFCVLVLVLAQGEQDWSLWSRSKPANA